MSHQSAREPAQAQGPSQSRGIAQQPTPQDVGLPAPGLGGDTGGPEGVGALGDTGVPGAPGASGVSSDTADASILPTIASPADVARLHRREKVQLAKEIREFLVDQVSRSGGHLGPNLGVVELTIALHSVFRSPHDTIVFDTGHQAYVHKLLTGRQDFTALRTRGGLSGYPSRHESEHDVLENSHASTALSWADGIAKAHDVTGQSKRSVVAVVGDGALTGGMAWEALNNIADRDHRLVIVVNDNGRSYSPTIGGLATHLDGLRTARMYERTLNFGERTLLRMGPFGRFILQWLRGLRQGIKKAVSPQVLFEDLGIKYLGPIDGHDLVALEAALARAQGFGEPIIVHVITEKGRGYAPAEQHDADKFHAVGRIHPETGLPVVASRFGWTSVFADEIVRIGTDHPHVVALTAAMLEPVGLAPFAREFPHRIFDVGIAEQHAVASAAGMAFAGLHPVVALYATFMNRAFDQVLMDVALHQAGVTFVLDRAGITGDDGASHNGMWDMAMLGIVPGIRVASPRDETTLRQAVREAVAVDDGPTVVRYPKGELPPPLPALGQLAGMDVIAQHCPSDGGRGTDEHGTDGHSDHDDSGDAGRQQAPAQTSGPCVLCKGVHRPVPKLVLVGIGSMAPVALEAARLLSDACVTVLAPTWVLPVPAGISTLGQLADLMVTVEDGVVAQGVGSQMARAVAESADPIPCVTLGLPSVFLDHASRAQIAQDHGLTPQGVAQSVEAHLARRRSQPGDQ